MEQAHTLQCHDLELLAVRVRSTGIPKVSIHRDIFASTMSVMSSSANVRGRFNCLASQLNIHNFPRIKRNTHVASCFVQQVFNSTTPADSSSTFWTTKLKAPHVRAFLSVEPDVGSLQQEEARQRRLFETVRLQRERERRDGDSRQRESQQPCKTRQCWPGRQRRQAQSLRFSYTHHGVCLAQTMNRPPPVWLCVQQDGVSPAP